MVFLTLSFQDQFWSTKAINKKSSFENVHLLQKRFLFRMSFIENLCITFPDQKLYYFKNGD